MLTHAFVVRLFGLPNKKVCALLSALDCIINIVKFVSGSFVLGVNQFLSQSCRVFTGMLCLDKILLNFSETPATYGMTMLWHLFLSSSCIVRELFLERLVGFDV